MSAEEHISKGSKWGWFSILTLIAGLTGTATYFLLPKFLPEIKSDIIVIKADDAPFKIRPENPGGKIVDHQELLVVDILKSDKENDGGTETLRPGASSPEPPPVTEAPEQDVKTAAQRADQGMAKANTAGEKTPATATPGSQAITAKQAVDSDPLSKTSPPKPTSTSKAKSGVASDTNGVKETAKQSERAVKTVKKPAKTVEKKPSTKSATNLEADSAKKPLPKPNKISAGKTSKLAPKEPKTNSSISKRVIIIEGDAPLYMLQLAAFRNDKKAAEMAGILSEKHKSRLNGLTLETMQVDTNSNGTFFRIVSAPMPREEANSFCVALRRAGQDCFLRKYSVPKE